MRILIMGTQSEPALAMYAALDKHGFDLSACDAIEQAADAVQQSKPDAILFEISQRHGDMTIFRKVQQTCADIPIVVLSDHDDAAVALEFIREGAQDYLVKGLAGNEALSRCLEYAIERNRLVLLQQNSETRMREVFEHSYDAFITTDSLWQITEWNPAAERTFGWKREEVLGQNLSRIIPRHLQRQFKHNIGLYFKDADSSFFRPRREIMAERSSGQIFPAEFSIFRIDKDSTCVFCAFVRDITAFKKSSEELEQVVHERTEKLLRSNEELYQFAKIASHDLQEPLRAVQGFANLLADAGKDKLDSDCLEFIEYILNGVSRMKELIQSILIHSRVSAADVDQCTNCNSVVDQVLTDLRPLIDETSASLDIDLLPDVAVEQSQVVQLFQNLIGNSLKYRSDSPPSISIAAKKTMRQWLFSICDNGIGIDPEYSGKIFDMFSRLHSKGRYPGTGIGLAICKKIVTSYGGTIWVESNLGQGSIFMFTLPAVKEKRTKAMKHKIDILLAEDTPSDVRLTEEALKRSSLHYGLDVVGDGVEAMEYLHKIKDTPGRKLPDIILLDLNMPRKDGHAVLEEIQKDPALRPIPVVLLTVSERDEDVLEALKSKMNYYLAKPVTSEKLSSLVKSLHEINSDHSDDTPHSADETHIRLVLAGNPHTSVVALSKLADDSHERVRSRVAENPRLTEELQIKLASDVHPHVRISLCENTNVSACVLEQLSKDENADVRLAATSSPTISNALLQALSHDENVYVCANAKKMLTAMV